MCGIAGAAWEKGARPLQREVLERMTRVLAHRGPDADGFHLDARDDRAGAALGHRRLSIIDVEGSPQPMANEDETVWVSFNGEIYNYLELREELQSRGHRFRTDGDTEVLVHAYEEYGFGLVERLRGMFAFALWDAGKGRLVLVRDRLGQKPLFVRRDGRHLYFASEMKALLQVPGAPREIDRFALWQYLVYQYVPHSTSILKGYREIPPAHLAVFEKGKLDVRRYWTPPYEPGREEEDTVPEDTSGWSPDRWSRELHDRLTESVRLRMRSDVPIGAFLSGGIDSSIVAGLMQRLSGSPIHTFSIGFSEASFDERDYAREVASTIGSQHHERVVEAAAVKVLPKLAWHYDVPFADSSAIPTMALAETTRSDVTVALSGDGGDELFGGYNRYQAVRLAGMIDALPRFARSVFGWDLWQKLPTPSEQGSYLRRAQRFLKVVDQPPERRYLNWIAIFDPEVWGGLLSPEMKAAIGERDPADFLQNAFQTCPGRDFVTRTTCADVLTYLPCDILRKVDVATMAHGLECRSPFLDHHVVELAAKMPVELKLRGRRGKHVLTQTFSELLPPSVRNRPKMGFGVPLGHWFRNELREFVQGCLLDRRSLERGYFVESEIRRLLKDHSEHRFDHGARLWSLLVLECWHRTWIDGEVPDGPKAVV